MQFIKTIQESIRIIWLISRLLIGLLFLYSVVFLLEDAEMPEYISAGFFFILSGASLWLFYAELFLGGAKRWLKITSGILSIFIAALLGFATVQTFGFDEQLLIAVPFFFLLLGVGDFISIKRSPKCEAGKLKLE